MEFISLFSLISNLVGDNHKSRKASNVAAKLHQSLHNESEKSKPRWAEIDKETGEPLYNSDTATKGMKILKHMAGWQRRESKELYDHISEHILAEKAGIDPNQVLMGHDVNGGMYAGEDIFIAMEIGFDHKGISEFLRRVGLNNNILPEADGQNMPTAETIEAQAQSAPAMPVVDELVSRGHVQERRDKLAELLAEIERRASEKGMAFDRGKFPGTKNEFREFAQKYDTKFYNLPTDNDRLDDDIKPLGIKFLKGNHAGKGTQFFKNLFPERY